jgi:hypothetical protein
VCRLIRGFMLSLIVAPSTDFFSIAVLNETFRSINLLIDWFIYFFIYLFQMLFSRASYFLEPTNEIKVSKASNLQSVIPVVFSIM